MHFSCTATSRVSLHSSVDLDTNNAAYLLVKQDFPPDKWQTLAMGLKQANAVSTIKSNNPNTISCLVALIKHWVANDPDKTWEKLVDAVARSEERVIAERLARDVGVPSPGECHKNLVQESFTSKFSVSDCIHVHDDYNKQDVACI